jgi:hypothetical protein
MPHEIRACRLFVAVTLVFSCRPPDTIVALTMWFRRSSTNAWSARLLLAVKI